MDLAERGHDVTALDVDAELLAELEANEQVVFRYAAGMNPNESARLTEFMEQLRDEKGLTILLIEHDMKVVMEVSEHITVLDHGEKIAEGKPQEIRDDERVVEAYLGKKASTG